MKKAFLLVVLTAAPAWAGGWPWSRCEYPKFQSEYHGFVDHWQPVVESRIAWRRCEDESRAAIDSDRMALSVSNLAYPPPAQSQPARATLPAPAPAPPTTPTPPEVGRPR